MDCGGDRFARLERIEWWDQERVGNARVLVIGAGALGNEVIKNLALLGIGNLVVADLDLIERSNLCRSVLFREKDEGLSKARCAVGAACDIYPEMRAEAIHGNVLADVGLGYFRWADVVVGAVDNREARVFINRACAMLGRPWIDGGIDVLNGIVRGFAPPDTACYECTMSRVDWEILNQRRSCSLLAGRAVAHGGVPTTPTSASIIGGCQAQEVVKILHGMNDFLGRGFVLEGRHHTSYQVEYRIKPDCELHEPPVEIRSAEGMGQRTTISALWELAEEVLGDVVAIDFEREIVASVECGACGWTGRVMESAATVGEDRLRCAECRRECTPSFLHSIGANSEYMDLTVEEVGLPAHEVVWARGKEKCAGIELSENTHITA